MSEHIESLQREKLRLEGELKKVTQALIILTSGEKTINTATSHTEDIPNQYSPNLTWELKIKFILSQIGEAYVKEMLDYLLSIDSNINEPKAFKRIQHLSSVLSRNPKSGVKAKSVGNKNIYYLEK